MTEEIIIDGVDVAECEHHLSTGYCQLQMIFQGMVFQLPFGKHLECNLCDKDCYYKQLKRLEQENRELKKQIESQKGLITVNGKQQYEKTKAYDKCKTALEEIREIAENAKGGRYTTKSEDYTEGMHTIGCYVLTRINEVLNV